MKERRDDLADAGGLEGTMGKPEEGGARREPASRTFARADDPLEAYHSADLNVCRSNTNQSYREMRTRARDGDVESRTACEATAGLGRSLDARVSERMRDVSQPPGSCHFQRILGVKRVSLAHQVLQGGPLSSHPRRCSCSCFVRRARVPSVIS